MSADLFEEGDIMESSSHLPLAARMRPETLEDVLGQEHLLGEGRLLRRTLDSDRLMSVIFYGPPGTGKTTLAKLISKRTQARFVLLNAVDSNVGEIRKAISEARRERGRRRTVLFIDEIHRFNKAQQDVLMPFVEDGTITLVGATTHNPSFSVNGPLLSRSLICELRPLDVETLVRVLERALVSKGGCGTLNVKAEKEALIHLARQASGDARRALNSLEIAVMTTPPGEEGVIRISTAAAEESSQRRIVYYDRDEDYHYDTASAFIKSMRGSDPDAAVFWLAKMLYAGEDPRFIIRRIIILASEDIGNADPRALLLATSGMQAIEFVGMPEARIILAQIVVYMAMAPKSNASYNAIEAALESVREDDAREVPGHLRDRSYQGAKRMGHGEGYKYPHNASGHYVDQSYFPSETVFYNPSDQGEEAVHQSRLASRTKGKSNSSPSSH